ncbi:uncharacterized protein LOC133716934 [Rosa rugosa]|uniref:uncharacterized protein LOC133716934 n=1 Tax=Rosa rugosa TaxID=74645 RepID=UPI002B407268|nr:uncharacterized protein LOC133716934 [Rosa rugosa]
METISALSRLILWTSMVDLLAEGTDFNCIGDWVVEATVKKKLNVMSVHLTSSKSLVGVAGVALQIQKKKKGRDVDVMVSFLVGILEVYLVLRVKEEIDQMIKCFNCHEYDHYKNECSLRRSENKQFHAKFAEDNNDSEETLLMAFSAMSNDEQITWYQDTGCSNHMSGRKKLFVELNESIRSEITFGNAARMPVKGNAKISIQLKNGMYNTI